MPEMTTSRIEENSFFLLRFHSIGIAITTASTTSVLGSNERFVVVMVSIPKKRRLFLFVVIVLFVRFLLKKYYYRHTFLSFSQAIKEEKSKNEGGRLWIIKKSRGI